MVAYFAHGACLASTGAHAPAMPISTIESNAKTAMANVVVGKSWQAGLPSVFVAGTSLDKVSKVGGIPTLPVGGGWEASLAKSPVPTRWSFRDLSELMALNGTAKALAAYVDGVTSSVAATAAKHEAEAVAAALKTVQGPLPVTIAVSAVNSAGTVTHTDTSQHSMAPGDTAYVPATGITGTASAERVRGCAFFGNAAGGDTYGLVDYTSYLNVGCTRNASGGVRVGTTATGSSNTVPYGFTYHLGGASCPPSAQISKPNGYVTPRLAPDGGWPWTSYTAGSQPACAQDAALLTFEFPYNKYVQAPKAPVIVSYKSCLGMSISSTNNPVCQPL